MEFTSAGGVLLLNGERFHLKGTSWFGMEVGVSSWLRFQPVYSSFPIPAGRQGRRGNCWQYLTRCKAVFLAVQGGDNALHGLWSVTMYNLLDFLQRHSFNALRVPLSAELSLHLDDSETKTINFHANPGLKVR